MKDPINKTVYQAATTNAQKPGDIIRITTTISCGTDAPAVVDVIPLKVAIADAPVPAGLEVTKLVGNRFDVLDIVKSYGAFANAAGTLVKSGSQERPIRSRRNMVSSCNSKNDVFHKRLKAFIDKEIHIKLEEDENAVTYTLREIEKEFLVVDYGESQRYIPINKILFLQIGAYPRVNAF